MAHLFLVVIAMVTAGSVYAQDARSSSTDELIERYFAMRKAAWNGAEKMLSNDEKSALTALVEEVKLLDSTSFAYHFLAYTHDPFGATASAHLTRAKQVRPSHNGVLHASIQNAHFIGNMSALRKALEALQASPYNLKTDDLTYHRHVLSSLPPNAILITNGDEDTHPLLLLQYIHGLRTDVQVIRVDFLQQVTFLKQTSISPKGHVKFLAANRSDVVALAFITFPAERIHLALTLPSNWLQKRTDGIINGLALGRLNAGHTLPDLVNRTASISPNAINPSQTQAHRFDRNYLPLFLILEAYHKSASNGLAKGYTDAIARIKPKLKNPSVIDNLSR